MTMLADDDIVTRHPDQVSADLNGEAVVLTLPAGVYYGMNNVGARVWELVREPRRVSVICEVIVSEFAVDPSACHADVVSFLEHLRAEGLIDVATADG